MPFSPAINDPSDGGKKWCQRSSDADQQRFCPTSGRCGHLVHSSVHVSHCLCFHVILRVGSEVRPRATCATRNRRLRSAGEFWWKENKEETNDKRQNSGRHHNNIVPHVKMSSDFLSSNSETHENNLFLLLMTEPAASPSFHLFHRAIVPSATLLLECWNVSGSSSWSRHPPPPTST